jgi:kynureninase
MTAVTHRSTPKLTITRNELLAQDTQDPLAHCRARFKLPAGIIYLDGNSLGAMPLSVPPRLSKAVETEWAEGLIRSWNDADWYPAPQRVGGKIAGLIGAQPDEVIMADSTSVNLFKVLIAALRLRPERKKIIGEVGNFPTDSYISHGVAELMGATFHAIEAQDLIAAITEEVAIVSLTHVNYKTGRIHDMQAITQKAHSVGALIVWDLAHTAGAMPCELNKCNVDFAVGCGYKYLNGGPGAPAFVFVASKHHATFSQPLTGWHGHAKPFDFSETYEPAKGMDSMLVGTASQLSLIALEAALEAFDGVDMQMLRTKSLSLTDLFIRLVDQELSEFGFGLATPRDPASRGSQVSLTHPQGYAIMQAVIDQGVIGDFRAPDILRFGFASLYVRYIDVWNAIETLKNIMVSNAWQAPQFAQRKAVT